MIENVSNKTFTFDPLAFGWVDHSVFSLMLLLSMLVGVYFGLCARAKNTAKVDYLLGGKKMGIAPVAVSLIASNISGITVMGVPTEVYSYGSLYWLVSFSAILVAFVFYIFYLPVFFELQLTSTYEYLEQRFDRRVRVMASGLFTLCVFLYTPVVIYVPALAFSQVTGINVHVISILASGVCIFYTMMGGLKAVVWTDFIQGIIALCACFTIVWLGLSVTGGHAEVWRLAEAGGRLKFFDMTPSPFVRCSFWSVLLGSSASWLSSSAANQGTVQKFLSLPDMRSARFCLIGYIVGIFLMKTISVYTGLLIYASYRDCDPLEAKIIQRPDQLLPFYVMDVASNIPGLPGVFVAGIFSAALSTMSGSLNCVCATIYEDFILPRMKKRLDTESKGNIVMKIIVFVLGVLCVAMIFVVERLGGVLQIAYSVNGVTTGALLGLFTLGMFFPWATSRGALTGAVSSLVLMTVIVTGSQYSLATGLLKYPRLPTSITGCGFENTTDIAPIPSLAGDDSETSEVFILFQISFMYYCLIGALTTVVVGVLISFIYGARDPKDLDPALLVPQIRWMTESATSQKLLGKGSTKSNGIICNKR